MTAPDQTRQRATLWRSIEPFWVAALGVHFVVLGHFIVPRLIRALGRAGQVETVEWAIYMGFLIAYLPAAWLVGHTLPRLSDAAAMLFRRLLVLGAVVEGVILIATGTPLLLLPAAIGAAVTWYLIQPRGARAVSATAADRTTFTIALGTGIAAWMTAGTLVHWGNALEWLLSSGLPILAVLSLTILVAAALRHWITQETAPVIPAAALDWALIAILVLFSFRTYPVVEIYHWGFFTGPIDHLREGGTLLWDTPSQYGFVSLLLPTLLPGNAWQSFWFFQAITYSVVTATMYLGLRRLAPGWMSALASFAVTFTTIFFRPRGATWLLPAQMTPGAGPFRFMWCFLMLAFIARRHRDAIGGRGYTTFVAGGSLIWLMSLLWSAETSVYVTAIWMPALAIRVFQDAALIRESGRPLSAAALHVAGRAVITLAIPLFAAIAVFIIYGAFVGRSPDLHGHVEYVLLYSRFGYGALPIESLGTIWYLILIFMAVSTVLVLHAVRNPRDRRLIVWAAGWGAVWTVSSYFTGRSHPANLFSIVPLLLYTLALTLRQHPFEWSLRARRVFATALLPLFVMPAALAAGHANFARAVTEPQLPPSRFVEQVPFMEAELQSLLESAGATPRDPIVRLGDGRLTLPAWRPRPDSTAGLRQTSRHSWLPKPFEMIGSLSHERRQLYMERNAVTFPQAGWFVHHRSDTARGTRDLFAWLARTRREEQRVQGRDWTVYLLGPVGSAEPAQSAR